MSFAALSPRRTFASDNYAGVHSDILRALTDANMGHAASYGDDPYTEQAILRFQEHFGPDIDVFFVFNGTGANVLSLASMARPYHTILCSEHAHIAVDECSGPERFIGAKLALVPAPDGKINITTLTPFIRRIGDQHASQPHVISLSQTTEYGTVYTPEEICLLTDYAHAQGMLVHMDGARLANAAASLNVSLRALTSDAGIDVLSFGGTKNGLMFGEAVVFFNKALAADFVFQRKQGMQLASKMRFIAVQFDTLLANDLWRHNAAHANAMATKLAEVLRARPDIHITQSVQGNAVFAVVPSHDVARLQAKYPFYVWNESRGEVRLVTSFDTTEEDVLDFARILSQE
jgi:threonine aldolase